MNTHKSSVTRKLSRVIRDNNLTRKRTRTRYNKPINFKKEMKIFYDKVDKFSIHKIISIYETSIRAEKNRLINSSISMPCIIINTNII